MGSPLQIDKLILIEMLKKRAFFVQATALGSAEDLCRNRFATLKGPCFDPIFPECLRNPRAPKNIKGPSLFTWMGKALVGASLSMILLAFQNPY